MGNRARRAAALLAAVVMLAGCGTASQSLPPAAPSGVVVASFNFPESELLAEIYAQALEQAGIPVRRELDLGPRELVLPAAQQGMVDVLPDYLGSALESVAPSSRADRHDSAAVLAALRTWLGGHGLAALTPARATDQNGFAVTRATAGRLHLRTLSNLAAVAPRLTLGGPTECPQRPYCLLGLQRVYGLHFAGFAAYDDETQRMTALIEGVIDVAVTFTTAGELATGRLVLLTDNRHLQPVEQVVPVVSQRALTRYGVRLERALDAVSAALDSPVLRFLNWRIGLAGASLRGEATGWLLRHRLLH
jgi:osmoprotectant transport system substrate-binding protein